DISALLEQHGAKFLYVLDIAALEGRTWDNAGSVEDVATGSAAGPTAAYLHKHQLITDEQVSIAQGRFANRPSAIEVALHLAGGEIYDISVSGQVVKVADLSFCT
ncbi:MAG: PhzF family phenazine biosynthesis protein, partial [Pseudomonadales bacterium]